MEEPLKRMTKVEGNRKYREARKEYSGYGIIYKATCLVNGKVYIGKTIRSLYKARYKR